MTVSYQAADPLLMKHIQADLGDYIAGAIEGTPFSAALIAAIVANESGGQATVQRFEPSVFASLAEVLTAQKPNYAPAGCKKPLAVLDLLAHVWPQTLRTSAAKPGDVFTFPQGVLALMSLSTSYGPTQIMGWHSVEFSYPLGDLPNLHTHFEHCVELLTWFSQRYNLQAESEVDKATALFHCWNTGSPIAPTYDPDYVANGLRRMQIYAQPPAG